MENFALVVMLTLFIVGAGIALIFAIVERMGF